MNEQLDRGKQDGVVSSDHVEANQDDTRGNYITGFGTFPSDWAKKSITNCAKIRDRERIPLNSTEREELKPGNIPYYGANGVVDYINDYLFDSELILLAEDGGHFDEFTERPIAYRVSGKAWINNHAHVLQARDSVNNEYLFYSLEHRNLVPYVSGSTRAKLTRTMLEKVSVPIPPLPEQRKIASVLYTVDQAIQKTEEIIEQTRRLHEGTERKLLRNGLFANSETQVTATGTYPAHWKISPGRKLFSLRSGEFLDSSDRTEEGRYPVYGGNGILGYTDQSRVPKNTPVVGRVGAYCGNIHLTREEAWVTDNAILLQDLSDDIRPGFLQHALRQIGLNRFAEQSAQPRISQSTLKNLKIPVPPEEEQQQIVDVLSSIKNRWQHERRSLRGLQRLKRGLMQDLLTGEVRTADKAIEVLDEVAAHG